MADYFATYGNGLESPASGAAAVTPGATALPVVGRALYIGGGGDVTVTVLGGGNDVTFVGVPAGSILPVRCTHVLASTTATNIINLW